MSQLLDDLAHYKVRFCNISTLPIQLQWKPIPRDCGKLLSMLLFFLLILAACAGEPQVILMLDGIS